MASTNKTANYNLPQFISTDKPSWLSDVNGAFNDIDVAMKSIEDKADADASDIDALELRVGASETNIASLQASSSQQGGDITDLKAQDIIIKNDITNLQNNKANVSDTEYNAGDTFTATANDNLIASGLAVTTSRMIFTIPLDKAVESSGVSIENLRLWVRGVNGTILNGVVVSDDASYTINSKVNPQGISIDLTHNSALSNMVANTPLVVTIGGTIRFI